MIDKLMKKYGYEKTDENRCGVYYKKREPQVNNDFISGTVGVEIPILLLMWMKAKWMARKYHWNQRKPNVQEGVWACVNKIDPISGYRCSKCRHIVGFDLTPYCPNCGAKMDGGDTDEAD